MTPAFSLRARVLLGAALWTVGLFAVSGVILTQIMFHHPSAPKFFHGVFAHVTAVSILALLCMIAGLSQVRRGLSPVNQLRERLAAVHQGRDRRVEGIYPAEVQPLVNDLNALLDHREQAVKRAVARAGDLAHGLKTPLAVLSQEAERAAASGQQELVAGRQSAGGADEATGRIAPGPRARSRIRGDAWRPLPGRGVGGGVGADDAPAPR